MSEGGKGSQFCGERGEKLALVVVKKRHQVQHGYQTVHTSRGSIKSLNNSGLSKSLYVTTKKMPCIPYKSHA